MILKIFKIVLSVILVIVLLVSLFGCSGIKADQKTDNAIIENIMVKDKAYYPDTILISVPVWREKWVTEEQFSLLKTANVDAVMAVSGVETGDFSVSRKMIEIGEKTGLGVFVHETQYTGDVLNWSDEEIIEPLKEFKNSRALLGYHIIDEPFNPYPFARIQKIIYNWDRNHILDTNILPGMAYESYDNMSLVMDDYLKILGNVRTYLSFDNYPFGPVEGTVDESALFGNLEAVRKTGLENGVPTAFYVQSVGGFGNSYRRPDAAQLSYHIGAALAYGIKWIKYWSWYVPDYGENPDKTYDDYTDAIIGKDGKPTELYEVAKELNDKVHSMGTILAKCDAVSVFHTGAKSSCKEYDTIPDDWIISVNKEAYAIVSVLKHSETGDYYLMIVNKNMQKNQTISVSVDSKNYKDIELTAGGFELICLGKDKEYQYESRHEYDNILRNAQFVTATHAEFDYAWKIKYMFDGETLYKKTRKGYSSGSDDEVEFYFTYDKKVSFDRVDIYPTGAGSLYGKNLPTAISIYVSDNGKDWEKAFEQSGIVYENDTIPSYSFDSSNGMYIKIVLAKSGGFELSELCLYNTAEKEIPIAEKPGMNIS